LVIPKGSATIRFEESLGSAVWIVGSKRIATWIPNPDVAELIYFSRKIPEAIVEEVIGCIRIFLRRTEPEITRVILEMIK